MPAFSSGLAAGTAIGSNRFSSVQVDSVGRGAGRSLCVERLRPHAQRAQRRPRQHAGGGESGFGVSASASSAPAIDSEEAAGLLVREVGSASKGGWALSLADFGGLRGMAATKLLKKGSVVARVAKGFLIDAEKVKAEKELSAWLDSLSLASLFGGDLPYEHLIDHVSTALFMLLHRRRAEEGDWRRDSRWGPYLMSMPYGSFDDFPVFWSEAELEALQGSRALQRAREAQALYPALHEHIAQSLRGPKAPLPREWLTAERLAWALNAVSSRCFGREGGSGRPEMVMVPGGDLLNHEARAVGPNVEWGFEEGSGDLVVRAARDVAPGQQALAFYGAHPNAHLLVECGFAVAGNAHDFVDVKLGVREADPLRGAKLKAAAAAMRGASERERTGAFELRAGGLPPGLARFAALATAQSAEEVAAVEKALKANKLEATTEARVRQALAIVLAARLKQYALEGGETGGGSARRSMAATVVEGEKAILMAALQTILGKGPLL